MSMLTHARLLELLDYDPKTGFFTRKVSLSSRSQVGERAGTAGKHYRFICVDGKNYAEHRVAWFYVHGSWPTGDLDHEDRQGHHNWIENLRPASESQNTFNSSKRTNLSGFKGVSLQKGKFVAVIRVKGKKLHLGTFVTAEDAAKRYDQAAIAHAGAFAATNQRLGLIQ